MRDRTDHFYRKSEPVTAKVGRQPPKVGDFRKYLKIENFTAEK